MEHATSRPLPLTVCAAALAGLLLSACPCRAERLFVGILEADGYQSVIYGASAFSRIAEMPLAQEWVQVWLAKNLSLPSFAGIAASAPLHIVKTIDPALPLSPNNPANVALIPLSDDGSAALKAFAAAYKSRTPTESAVLFENPSDTNLPPRVAVAVAGRHLLTSTSRDAFAWAWNNRAKLIDAPSQSIPGTFRVVVNPQRLADLLGTRGEKAAAVLNVDKLLRDFETLSFSLTLEGPALAITLRGSPRKDSALDALVAAWREPSSALWYGVPDNAFFAALVASDRPELWEPFLGKTRSRLFRPVDGLVPQSAFSGERLLYIVPTKNRQGLCFVQLEPVTNAAPVRAALSKLHTARTNDTVVFTPQARRESAGAAIETYSITLRPPAPGPGGKPPESSILHTLLSLFLRKAVLETTVANGYLITVIGPENTLQSELPPPAFPVKPLSLNRKIGVQDPALNENLALGASLQAVGLLRHIVSIMPEVKPEQARLLPAGGDGASLGISLTGHTLTASLRVQSNEIAALQRINRDGREVLQELFFQMFAKQMMEMRQPSDTPPQAP